MEPLNSSVAFTFDGCNCHKLWMSFRVGLTNFGSSLGSSARASGYGRLLFVDEGRNRPEAAINNRPKRPFRGAQFDLLGSLYRCTRSMAEMILALAVAVASLKNVMVPSTVST